VFFIVLDLRLTKVGARRCSFFYVHTFGILKKNGIFVNKKYYLTATNTDHGLLINFGGERIEIKRKFREYKHKNNA